MGTGNSMGVQEKERKRGGKKGGKRKRKKKRRGKMKGARVRPPWRGALT